MQQLFTHGDAQWQELGSGTRRRIRSYNDSVMMVEVQFDKNGVGSLHTHPHTQVTYCLEGEFTFTVNGNEVRLAQGDTLLFPSGTEHGCVSPTGGLLLDIFTPARKDFLK